MTAVTRVTVGFAAALLLLSVPASAGFVYIPVAGHADDDALVISVTNIDQSKQWTMLVGRIDLAADGTDKVNRTGLGPFSVPGGRTSELIIDPTDQAGLLEIEAAPQFRLKAEIWGPDRGASNRVATQVPIISSENAIDPGEAVELQGWRRDAEVLTALGIVNLGTSKSKCTIDVRRPNGSSIVSAIVTPRPLSLAYFGDALGIIGEQSATEVTSTISCDQPFFAYLRVRNHDTDTLEFITPSASGTSTLDPEGTVAQECSAGAVCFQRTGLVHRATPAKKSIGFEFPVPPGTYDSLHMTFELKNPSWHPRGSSLRYMLFWMVKNLRNKDMFGYAFVEGPNRNQMVLRHGFGQAQGLKAKKIDDMQWPEGQTYVVDYLYDTGNQRIVLTLMKKGGTVVSQVTGRPDINRIKYANGGTLSLGLGNEDINIKEPTQLGWEWSNLFIELTPAD